MRDTNTLSTMLYMDWASMEIMMGTAMDSTSWGTGMTPSLFSVSIGDSPFSGQHKVRETIRGAALPAHFTQNCRLISQNSLFPRIVSAGPGFVKGKITG